MGFGKLFKTQDKLTDYSNSLALQAGSLKQQAANTEADMLQQQGDLEFLQAQKQAALFARENTIAAGQQEEQYLASGVNLMGSPLAVTSETRALGQFKLDAFNEFANAARDLEYRKAAYARQQGAADMAVAQGSATLNTLQNQLEKERTRTNFYQGIGSGLTSAGLSVLSPFAATGVGKAFSVLKGLFT